VNSVRPVSAPKVDGNEALRAKVTASKHVAHKTPQVADEQPLEEQGTAASTEAQLFQQALSEHIGQYRKYPERARQGAMSGVVEVGFTMDRSGAVLKVWIRHDSGFVLLDGEAIATIWRAQPLPRIPPNLPDRLDVFLPISFSLT
jgi:protein TonB